MHRFGAAIRIIMPVIRLHAGVQQGPGLPLLLLLHPLLAVSPGPGHVGGATARASPQGPGPAEVPRGFGPIRERHPGLQPRPLPAEPGSGRPSDPGGDS